MACEDRMHRGPQYAASFAVNDPHFPDALFTAQCEVVQDHLLDLLRLEGVEVEHAVDGKFHRRLVVTCLFWRVHGLSVLAVGSELKDRGKECM